MRILAEFIMRGRLQAAGVAVVTAAVPMLFWLSAATVALIILRRGLSEALPVMLWAVLPAVGWWFMGDPRTLLVLGGAVVLAGLHRAYSNWSITVLGSVAVGLVYALVVASLFDGFIASLIEGTVTQIIPETLPGVWEEMSASEQAAFQALLGALLTGLFAALLQVLALLALLLGRYWQAVLYNPGGLGGEFRALRFRPLVAMGLLVGIFLAPNLGSELAVLAPLCSVPLVFASLALAHGLVAQGRLMRFWLVGLYVAMVLFLQFLYPLLAVLAVIDSFFDFRGRARDDAEPPRGED